MPALNIAIGPTARGLRSAREITTVTRAIRAMHRVLSEIGWASGSEGTAPRVRVDLGPPYTPVSQAIVAIDTHAACLIACFDLGPPVAADRIEQVVRFVTRANCGLLSGSFEVDLKDGTIHFRTGVVFGAGELSEAVIRATLAAAMRIIDAHSGVLLQVVAGGADADDAIAAVWRVHDEPGGHAEPEQT